MDINVVFLTPCDIWSRCLLIILNYCHPAIYHKQAHPPKWLRPAIVATTSLNESKFPNGCLLYIDLPQVVVLFVLLLNADKELRAADASHSNEFDRHP